MKRIDGVLLLMACLALAACGSVTRHDECAQGTHDCVGASGGGICTQTSSGYQCSCADGYSGDGTTSGTGCTDLDECLSAPCDANAVCTNTAGSFSCACDVGYTGDGLTCTPVDCGGLAAPINGTVSLPGGTTYNQVATYACDMGYLLAGDETRTCQADASWSGSAPQCLGCANFRLRASQSVSANYRPNGGLYADNNTRAYSNPTGDCGGGPPCDITGWLGFDTSPIFDSAEIGAMTLNLYTRTVSATPLVRVQYSAANNWTRGTVTLADLVRTNPQVSSVVTMQASDVGSFKPFPIDVGAQDFRADVLDNWLTLGVDNTELSYSYAYFDGSDAGTTQAYLDVTACGCTSSTVTLPASQSVSVNYRPGGNVFRDNNTRAYSNPTGDCGGGAPCDITGWLGFDTSSVPNTAAITGVRLYLNTTTVAQAAPLVRVQYSSGNNWTRGTVIQSDLPRTNAEVSNIVTMMASDVGSFKEFVVDPSLQNYRADLVDNWLTLGVDNTELSYSYAYFDGSDAGATRAYLQLDICTP